MCLEQVTYLYVILKWQAQGSFNHVTFRLHGPAAGHVCIKNSPYGKLALKTRLFMW